MEFESLERRSVMKKCCIIAVVLLLFSGGIVYADQFGPPEPLAQQGKVAFGVGYFYGSETLKPSNDTFAAPGAIQNDFWQKATFNQNKAYIQLNYGVCKNWEVFGRLGGADLQSKEAFNFNAYTDDFRDSYQVYGTLGFKGVLYSNPKASWGPFSSFSIGPIIKGSYYSDYSDSASGAIGGTAVNMTYNVKEMWDVNLAISMQTKVMEKVTLFAGPFVYWRNLKSSLDIQIVGTGTFSDSTKYESENNIGGFAGFRVPLTNALSLDLEAQYTNQFGAGASVMYRF
jgi:hypothetical protein